MNQTFTCIICPRGCSVCVELDDITRSVRSTTGYHCPRGRQYAESEAICPKRTLTSTVALRHSAQKRLPVKTSSPIAKDQIFDCMRAIRTLSATAPVHMGDIIAANLLPGCDIIAARSVEC